MQYILFLFLLTSFVSAALPQKEPITLEKKIQDLEKELNEMRFQAHVENRVYGRKKTAELMPVESKPLSPKVPENNDVGSEETTVELMENTEVEHEAPEPSLPEEYELYEQGRHYLAQQRLDLARQAFDEIVEKYDETPESILARFWIGDFMLRDKNYPGASIALGQAYGALKKARRQKGFSKDMFHGEEDRLPEILAKLAYALKMINKRQDACITLRQMKKDYKKRPATLEWYVKKLSKELKCR